MIETATKRVHTERQHYRSPKPHSDTYRPDIDGLRALAVLSVVGFHANPRLLPGGYVGVDIFFVISGFLITSIICRNLERGRFSFVDFYARRSKRIFPALIIVLFTAWLCGWMVLLTDEYEQLGKHIAAGAGFISNFALWLESGYFDKAAESKPLLHLWSLGIEEQFYLLWPPLVVWAWKRKSNLIHLAGSIVIFSFAANVILVRLWPSTTFYLPPTRFWELLLGSLLGYMHVFRKNELDDSLIRTCSRIPGIRLWSIANVQSAIGVALLAVAVIALNSTSLFPGWWALLPTLSAFLLINAGPHAWINRNLLSRRPLVFIGLISYPLYLWHWPLLSFAHIVGSNAPSSATIAVAVGLAFVLAALTYQIVEKPVRAKPNPAALILIPMLIAVGYFGIALFSHRFHPRSERYHLEKIIEATKEEWGFPGRNLKPVHTALGWHWERGTATSKVLFVGDSNMQQYYPRIDRLLSEHPDTTKSILMVSEHGCAPIPMTQPRESGDPNCGRKMTENAFDLAQTDSHIDTVVIAAAWVGYSVFTEPAVNEAAFRGLESVVGEYRTIGRKVYLILPIPRTREFDPSYMVRRSLGDLGFQIVQPRVERETVDAVLRPITSRLTAIANSAGAITINPVDYLCHDEFCPTMNEDGTPIYRDAAHLRPSYVRNHTNFLDSIVSLD